MSVLAENLLEQALDLRASERARLVEKLLLSLDMPNDSIDKIWGREADARIAAYEAGDMHSIPASKVFSKYQRS